MTDQTQMTRWVRRARSFLAFLGGLEVAAFFGYLAVLNALDGSLDAALLALPFAIVHAAPFVLLARVPREAAVGIVAASAMLLVQTVVWIGLLRDEHSTAGLRIYYSLFGLWLIWGVAVVVASTIREIRGGPADEAEDRSSGAGSAR
jgi:hypothetical protein